MLRPYERAVVEALCPPQACERLPLGAFDAGFDAFYERLPKTEPASLYWGFRGALFAAGWIAPLLIRSLPPISRLAPEDRERALEALGRSGVYPLRQSLTLLKVVVSFCYGADERVRRAVGASK